MASFVKFELEDGTIVYMESTDVPKGSSGFPLGSKGEHPAEQASVSFEQSVRSVKKMAATLMQELREGFTQVPDEVQVNFGLKASAEVGALVVARGGMEANYGVMMRWRKPEENSPGAAQDKESTDTPAADNLPADEAKA